MFLNAFRKNEIIAKNSEIYSIQGTYKKETNISFKHPEYFYYEILKKNFGGYHNCSMASLNSSY